MSFIARGIIPAMVTPLTGRETLNKEAYRQLNNYVIDGGLHGVFALRDIWGVLRFHSR